MTSVKSHTGQPFSGSASTIRRKPALTYRSPVQSIALLHLETALLTSPGATPPLVVASPPPTRLPNISPVSEISEKRRVTHNPSRYCTGSTFLPLYHPFGVLALSLPDLDPTPFGLPVPVAVFDDPTPRSSSHVRRPAAKMRDADEPAAPKPPPFIETTHSPEVEPKNKPSPRRRGGGHRRKRKELEDGNATYPAKRSRNARSSGVTPGFPVTRTPSRDVASPSASNPNTGASPVPEPERGDPAEEKRPTRRTRARGVVARRDSTASEATVTSGSPSLSATNTAAAPQGASAEEPMETEASKEDTKMASSTLL